jgi:hypothetical protein
MWERLRACAPYALIGLAFWALGDGHRRDKNPFYINTKSPLDLYWESS